MFGDICVFSGYFCASVTDECLPISVYAKWTSLTGSLVYLIQQNPGVKAIILSEEPLDESSLSNRLRSVAELEDDGKDLVVEILDFFFHTLQLLKLKVGDLEEKRTQDLIQHVIPTYSFLESHNLMKQIKCSAYSSSLRSCFITCSCDNVTLFSSLPAPLHSPFCGGASFWWLPSPAGGLCWCKTGFDRPHTQLSCTRTRPRTATLIKRIQYGCKSCTQLVCITDCETLPSACVVPLVQRQN